MGPCTRDAYIALSTPWLAFYSEVRVLFGYLVHLRGEFRRRVIYCSSDPGPPRTAMDGSVYVKIKDEKESNTLSQDWKGPESR
jgi:hypothetical protein